MRVHGNWCGPGWTAGQYKDASELTEEDRDVPAIDSLDQACKVHDIELHDYPEHADVINQNFAKRARATGPLGHIFAAAVENFGPSPSPAMVGRTPAMRHMERFRQEANALENENRATRQREEDNWGNEVENGRVVRRRHNPNHPVPDNRGIVPLQPMADENMEETPEAEARMAVGGPSGGGNNQVSKETPISTYPSLSYGLQETHTTILPWTGWCSVYGLTTGTPVQIKLRMNSPYNMFPNTTNNNGAALAKGIYNKVINNSGSLASSATFPELLTNNAAAVNQRPAWRAFWAQQYCYYTVLGCEYKITVQNPNSTRGSTICIGIQQDSYSGTETSTGNVMPQTNLSEVMAFKNIRWEIIDCQSDAGNPNQFKVIAGKYYPGQIKRNIQNDGDVKTWTSTGSRGVAGGSSEDGASPTLSDILTLNFWQAPLAFADAGYYANMQIELKYIVQYKDLRQQARYPATTGTGADAGFDLNLTQTVITEGSALQRWN